jgi:hypothetical protein
MRLACLILATLLFCGDVYGQWNTNMWPSYETFFDGRKRSIQVYSSLYERASIISPTNAFHADTSYPRFFTQRSSLKQYKAKVKEFIPDFVDMTQTNVDGHFQAYFLSSIVRTNVTQHPGAPTSDFKDQVRTRLPEWSVTGLLVHVGAPTNYLDVTPFFKLNTVSNGWLFMPSIINELVAISAGFADAADTRVEERWNTISYTETQSWTNREYTSPGKNNASWTTLYDGFISDMKDVTQWGSTNPVGDFLFNMGDATLGNRGATSNSGLFLLYEDAFAGSRGNHIASSAFGDNEHTNFALQVQTYACAAAQVVQGPFGDRDYDAITYAPIWTNAAIPSQWSVADSTPVPTNIYPYLFFDVSFAADPANDNITIAIPIETNGVLPNIDFTKIPDTAPTGPGSGEVEWGQTVFGGDVFDGRPMQMLLNYNVTNGFKFVDTPGLAP